MIHDVYKINETSENVDTVPYGHWSSSSGMYIEDLNIWGRRANLKGFMFRYSGQFYLYWSKTNFNQILDIHIVTCFQLINISFHFRIASKFYPPEQTRADDGCTSSECFQGYYPNLIYALQSFMNFTFKITVNNVFGKKLPNGTWIGEIGK